MSLSLPMTNLNPTTRTCFQDLPIKATIIPFWFSSKKNNPPTLEDWRKLLFQLCFTKSIWREGRPHRGLELYKSQAYPTIWTQFGSCKKTYFYVSSRIKTTKMKRSLFALISKIKWSGILNIKSRISWGTYISWRDLSASKRKQLKLRLKETNELMFKIKIFLSFAMRNKLSQLSESSLTKNWISKVFVTMTLQFSSKRFLMRLEAV